jgi:hypothetical protein
MAGFDRSDSMPGENLFWEKGFPPRPLSKKLPGYGCAISGGGQVVKANT